jgi:hypothetical protein
MEGARAKTNANDDPTIENTLLFNSRIGHEGDGHKRITGRGEFSI